MTTQQLFVHIGVNARRSHPESWGDTQYAEALARAIRRHPGCDAALLFRGETPVDTDRPAVLLRIVGPHVEDPVPGLPNILWVISPPNLMSSAMLARYQALFCASPIMTEQLRAGGLTVEFLPQGTDVGHFNPACRPAGSVEIPIVFVGGYAPRAKRRVVLEAVEAGFDPQIWGPGWKDVVPERLWRGERLGYHELAEVYARSRIVLNCHMEGMAEAGFMSNRTYDAQASGAHVVSDAVAGYRGDELPALHQIQHGTDLARTLREILSARPLDLAERQLLHQRVAANCGFGARSDVIVATAQNLVVDGQKALPAFCPGRRSDAAVPQLSDPAASAPTTRAAVARSAREILEITRFLENPDAPRLAAPQPTKSQGVIHSLMADLREVQRIACDGAGPSDAGRLEEISASARRVAEVLGDTSLARIIANPSQADRLLAYIIANEPLWGHKPENFHRTAVKVSVPLWQRKEVPAAVKSVGVFLHLYHDDLASVFAERLRHIATPFRLYVSTDTIQKADRIRGHLPAAEVRVLTNRGRDIWPKLYGFSDAYDRHEIVLHLHGKKSLHSDKLDGWLVHILDCLLGSTGEVNRTLSLFASIPELGMAVPVTFKDVLGAAHWGANRSIARELAHRIGLAGPLPSDNELRFPVGSMFWARTAAIRSLLDLRLLPDHFPQESGQIDGTLAHALERMLGVACKAAGYHVLPVAGARSRLHVKYQRHFRSNGELRKALRSGDLDV